MTNRYVRRIPPESLRYSQQRVGEIARDCNTYPVLVWTLLNRGIPEPGIRSLLKDDRPAEQLAHMPLNGAEEAAGHILQHLKQDDTIAVFADYDCDGITSGYVMKAGLEDAARHTGSKSTVILHYPQRKDGYGLSMDYCRKAVKDGTVRLVITVDNGITTKEECRYLQGNGIELIVTDHHEPYKNRLPECIIVDPCFNDKNRSYLAGVAVAFNVISALARLAGFSPDPDKYYPPVAVGTISDCMPMSFENSGYIKTGLESISNGKACRYLSLMGSCPTGLTAKDISFQVAPMINAASRMGDTRMGAAGFFLDKEDEVVSAIENLQKLNDARREMTEQAKKAIRNITLGNNRIAVFDGSAYSKGIHGIIAGEIAKNFPDYPAFVYSIFPDPFGKKICGGSIRCNNEGLDCLDLFRQLKDMHCVIKAAGHSRACVLEVYEDKMPDFLASFNSLYDSIDIPPVTKELDAPISLKDAMNLNFFQALRRIPFTTQEEPLWGVSNVIIQKVVPSKNNPDNICLYLMDNTSSQKVWAWGWGKKYAAMGAPRRVHLVCTITQNFMYQEELKPTMDIKDILPA